MPLLTANRQFQFLTEGFKLCFDLRVFNEVRDGMGQALGQIRIHGGVILIRLRMDLTPMCV